MKPQLPMKGYIVMLLANGYIMRDTFSWTHKECASKAMRRVYEPTDDTWRTDWEQWCKQGAKMIRAELREVEE